MTDNEQKKTFEECDDSDASEGGDDESIVTLFDSLCVTFGDQDVIVLVDPPASADHTDSDVASSDVGDQEYKSLEPTAVCYLELQEASNNLASQLWHRYRPDYVLLDCFGHAVAEAVSVLACMRINVPFVPVELAGPSGPCKQSRVQAVVRALQEDRPNEKAHIVAICCCDGDDDPVLGVLYQANVHRILYVDPLGNLLESIRVPSLPLSRLPFRASPPHHDVLYVLFTSGTTSAQKAVVGSHVSTFRRLAWWRDRFSASPRIARRTKLTFVGTYETPQQQLLDNVRPSLPWYTLLLVSPNPRSEKLPDGITELFSPLLHPPSVLVALTHPYRLAQHGVSVLVDVEPTQITLLPSQLGQLLLVLQNQTSECSLQRVICSGEMFPVHLWERVQRFNLSRQRKGESPLEVINLYGQTESTGDVLCAVLTDMKPESVVQQGVIAVGSPIRDDISVSQSPSGGELVVSGNLAVRYLHHTSNLETLETGDAGFCDNGIWYVRGRRSEVDKVNGVWTSPSEVEVAVAQVFPSVRGAMAAAVVDGRVVLITEEGIPDFSRERMRNSGTPWNLIPHQVFRHSIPIQPSGAGKLDRQALRRLISDVLCKTHKEDGNNDFESSTKEGNEIDLVGLVGRVLDLPCRQIDLTMSFVDLGGDSATAVTLSYHLQARDNVSKMRRCRVAAVDILAASSLIDLRDWLEGKRPLKRAKHAIAQGTSTNATFCPSLPQQHGPGHWTVKFPACVDASPTVSQDGIHLFVGCQGGAVQKVCMATFTIAAHRHFSGWMIQADCVVNQDSVIVSLYNRRSATGRILSLSLDLDTVIFSVNFDGMVRVTPVLLEESILCVNVGEQSLRAVDSTSGKLQCAAELPEPSFSKPAVLRLIEKNVAVYAVSGGSITRATLRRDETGAHLDTAKLTNDVVESIGSVHKELCTVSGGSTVLVSGSFGALLEVTLNTATLSLESPKVTPISEYPLSPAGLLGNSDIVVGSYDGIVHIISLSGHHYVDVGASIYCKPLVLSDGSFVVCTTAGDVVRIRDHTVVWRYRVEAEIWSNPVLVDDALKTIAFGGRDSQLHIITIGGGN